MIFSHFDPKPVYQADGIGVPAYENAARILFADEGRMLAAPDRMMVIDHNSTSGTYVGTSRIQPGTPTPIDPNGILAFGPVPVQVQLLMRLAQAARGSQPLPQPGGAMPATSALQMPQPGLNLHAGF